MSPSLLSELVQGNTDRSAGDFDEPRIGLIHLDDQIERTRRRHCTNEQRGDHIAVTGCEEGRSWRGPNSAKSSGRWSLLHRLVLCLKRML
jgi:hypothetical protein